VYIMSKSINMHTKACVSIFVTVMPLESHPLPLTVTEGIGNCGYK
jgi:hypothetical protein